MGLIYVYPHGPQLRKDHPDFDATQQHQRSPKVSAQEVRDTFKTRMGWTDQETVALIGGGHTLGRAHGNCAAKPDSGELCKGKYTTTAGYEGAWTRTPSQWNYDFFEAMLEHEWVPTKSPDGADQWGSKDAQSPFAKTFRLTADLAMVNDPAYKEWAIKYHEDHALFDSDFAKAWFKLTHRSANHPEDDDLEKSANKCTSFEFASASVQLLTDSSDKATAQSATDHTFAFLGVAGLASVSLAVWLAVARRGSPERRAEGVELGTF